MLFCFPTDVKNDKSHFVETCRFFMVLLTGLEPVRYCYRGILSPLRLPISPQQHLTIILYHKRRDLSRVARQEIRYFIQTCTFVNDVRQNF